MRTWLLFSFCFTIFFNLSNFTIVKPFAPVASRPYLSTGVLVQRTVSISQRACSCPNASSCSCCQSVTILLQRVTKDLCVNFTYAQTGLSMDILLGSNTIRRVSIIDYRTFKVCTLIPDCFHSHACVDVIEISRFPRSITVCIQLAITSKSENWLINYNCMSISTVLSNQNQTGTTGGATQPVQSPSGQMPAGQMPPGQMPAGQMPAGQMPAGQMPPGQMPAGQMPAGQMPAGQMPPGQMPSGQMPSGQMPPGQMPPGQMPARQTQGLISERGRKRVYKSTRRVSGCLNWVSLRRSKEIGSADRIIENRSDTHGLTPGGGKNVAIDISPINIISKDIVREQRREPEDQEVQNAHFSNRMKIEYRDNFDTGNSTSNNYLPIEHFPNRIKREIHKQVSNGSSAMKMQVILRSRKNRLPNIIGHSTTKNFKIAVNHLTSRSSRIVNQNTMSIPMSGLGLSENVEILDTPLSNPTFSPVKNESQMGLAPPQQIPVIIPYGFPAPPPVLVLENVPSMGRPIPQDFSINYDNRTSSFPNRMPPSFGINSKIGPINTNKSPQSFDRSVEELETVGPQIQLLPNSKFIELESTTDFSDERIIFPD